MFIGTPCASGFRQLGDVDIRDERPELLGGLEHRNRARSHLDRGPCARVPGHPCLALPDLEGAEAAHLDVLLLAQRVLYRVEEGVDDASAVFLRDRGAGGLCNLRSYQLDEVRLCHPNTPMELAKSLECMGLLRSAQALNQRPDGESERDVAEILAGLGARPEKRPARGVTPPVRSGVGLCN